MSDLDLTGGSNLSPSRAIVVRDQLARIGRNRVVLALLLVSVVLDVTAVIGTSSKQATLYRAHEVSAAHATTTLAQLGFGSLLFATLAGALVSVGEFRERTIGRSILAVRGTQRLMLGQTVSALLIGAVFGVIGVLSGVGAAVAVERARHIPFRDSSTLELSMAGVLLACVLAAPWGLLLGWIGRRTSVTLGVIIVYTLVAEGAIDNVSPMAWKWLPGGAQSAIYGDMSALHFSMGAGIVIFLIWIVLAALVATIRARRGDLL
jgi:hypothetical protein